MSWKNKQRNPVNCHSNVFSGSIMVGWVTINSISVLETWAEVLYNYSTHWNHRIMKVKRTLNGHVASHKRTLHYPREVRSYIFKNLRRLFTKLILMNKSYYWNKNIRFSVWNQVCLLFVCMCVHMCVCIYKVKIPLPNKTRKPCHYHFSFVGRTPSVLFHLLGYLIFLS